MLKFCEKCKNYTLKEQCDKCKEKTKSAHYKFLTLRKRAKEEQEETGEQEAEEDEEINN